MKNDHGETVKTDIGTVRICPTIYGVHLTSRVNKQDCYVRESGLAHVVDLYMRINSETGKWCWECQPRIERYGVKNKKPKPGNEHMIKLRFIDLMRDWYKNNSVKIGMMNNKVLKTLVKKKQREVAELEKKHDEEMNLVLSELATLQNMNRVNEKVKVLQSTQNLW